MGVQALSAQSRGHGGWDGLSNSVELGKQAALNGTGTFDARLLDMAEAADLLRQGGELERDRVCTYIEARQRGLELGKF